MPKIRFLGAVALLFALSLGQADAAVDYATQIQPLLESRCYDCHGADQIESGLRWDLRRSALSAADSGQTPLVPGDVKGSRLLAVIDGSDPELSMPPAGKGTALSAAEVALIRRWVAEGAAWPDALAGDDITGHWAFTPPTRPALPEVADAGWARNPMDRFVLDRLEAANLKPTAEADRRTLARRLHLDLLGLPPSPAMVEAFAADRRVDAYERLVDRLLNDPAFGERWARPWLDLARFADTKGYEKDMRREIWRYRDWVIDAINADAPFDQFSIEQLAGDMLPEPTQEQILATAFHRNTMSNDEGGTDDEEFRQIAVKDRVDTTAQIWMGLTLGCAKCHSHKYDPLTQRDYYRFMGFFNQSEDADRFDDEPKVAMPTDRIHRHNASLDRRLAKLQAKLDADDPQVDARQAAWESKLLEGNRWQFLEVERAESSADTPLELRSDRSVVAGGPVPATDTYTLLGRLDGGGFRTLGLETLGHAGRGPGRAKADPNFVIHELVVEVASVEMPQAFEPVKFSAAQTAHSQGGWNVSGLIDGNPDTGWAIGGQTDRSHAVLLRAAEPFGFEAGTLVRVRMEQNFGGGLVVARVRLSASAEADAAADKPAPLETLAVVTLPAARRTADDALALRRIYRAGEPKLEPLHKAIAEAEATRMGIPLVPIMRELPESRHRETHIHRRGNFLSKGDKVEPAVPEAFASSGEEGPRDRLGIARWLVSDANPLFARVTVNRVFGRLFGMGIVETEEDFGTQGLAPSHPQLLDELAVWFASGGLSHKRLVRRIVLSATYRQASTVSDASLAADPRNRLLSRGPRFRLEAEAVRDNALAVAGLLDRTIGGASVMPRQPSGIWASVYSGDIWKTSSGGDAYRRGLYTFIRRTSPYPSMLAFDAPSREVCSVRRIRTNTPLQALVTLNDPVFVEAAQALARRASREAGSEPAAQIALAMQLATTRPVRPAELAALLGLYERRLTHYRQRPSEAEAFATEPLGPLPADRDVAAMAALSAVCNVLLNLDEIQTKG